MFLADRKSQYPATRYVCEWTDTAALAGQIGNWRNLMRNAAEPNPFYGPDYLLASAAEIENARIRCVAIYRDSTRNAEMIGLFPLMHARLYRKAVLPSLEFYRNDYICSTVPLLHADDAEGVCAGFLDAFSQISSAPRTVIAGLLPSQRPAATALAAALTARGCRKSTVSSHERAAVETRDTKAVYLGRASASRRKDLRRRMRRLEEQGTVTFRTISGGPQKQAALEDFLRVEASGWKSTSGTAMASRAETHRFAAEVFLADNAEFDILAVDGKAIAVCASLIEQGVKFTVKTAYDEAFRASSPGALLDESMLGSLTAGGALKRADSCARPGHEVEGLWREKEAVERIVFALQPSVTAARVESVAKTLQAVERLSGWVRHQLGR